VLLDEIGELSPALQAKLLRVLQEREFERVGGTRSIAVDFRLLAATNCDLEQAIAAGTFRRDLYYRLNVVSLAVPSLRDRPEDIPLLANHFARRHAAKAKRRLTGVSPEALAYLTAYDWPGNVRELENAIERAVVLGSTDLIVPDDLPEGLIEAVLAPAARRRQVRRALSRCGQAGQERADREGVRLLRRQLQRRRARARTASELLAPPDPQPEPEGAAEEVVVSSRTNT
jgi:transcriptional regulator with PAS, ATPase and Fis domain